MVFFFSSPFDTSYIRLWTVGPPRPAPHGESNAPWARWTSWGRRPFGDPMGQWDRMGVKDILKKKESGDDLVWICRLVAAQTAINGGMSRQWAGARVGIPAGGAGLCGKSRSHALTCPKGAPTCARLGPACACASLAGRPLAPVGGSADQVGKNIVRLVRPRQPTFTV